MTVCCIPGCRNNNRNARKNDVSFHAIPKDPVIRKKWLKFCSISYREDAASTTKSKKCVCSSHFTENCMVRDLKSELLNEPPKRRLVDGAVPTIKVRVRDQKTIPSSRSKRADKREQKQIVSGLLQLGLPAQKNVKEDMESIEEDMKSEEDMESEEVMALIEEPMSHEDPLLGLEPILNNCSLLQNRVLELEKKLTDKTDENLQLLNNDQQNRQIIQNLLLKLQQKENENVKLEQNLANLNKKFGKTV